MFTTHFAPPHLKDSVLSEIFATRCFSATAATAVQKRTRSPKTVHRKTLKNGRIANVVPNTAW